MASKCSERRSGVGGTRTGPGRTSVMCARLGSTDHDVRRRVGVVPACCAKAGREGGSGTAVARRGRMARSVLPLVLATALFLGCGSTNSPVTPTAEAGLDAAGDSAPDANSASLSCAARQPHCGPCDYGGWSTCVRGQWVCESGFYQFGCECYQAKTMGLPKCCASDAGEAVVAECSVAESGYGHYGSGTLTCPNGGIPYVKDAGAGSCP